jgi:hypothetical protein
MNKKVLRTTEKDGKITLHCADSTTYEGDILVGADGLYSSIRQNMYKKMDEQGLLPKSDLEGFTVGYITTVGVAFPQNPGKYPQLAENISHFSSTIGENNQTVSIQREQNVASSPPSLQSNNWDVGPNILIYHDWHFFFIHSGL